MLIRTVVIIHYNEEVTMSNKNEIKEASRLPALDKMKQIVKTYLELVDSG